ncbi:hypothetical protein HC928_05155 [bacterium]|nr:hypothetical protein [bacterium]
MPSLVSSEVLTPIGATTSGLTAGVPAPVSPRELPAQIDQRSPSGVLCGSRQTAPTAIAFSASAAVVNVEAATPTSPPSSAMLLPLPLACTSIVVTPSP